MNTFKTLSSVLAAVGLLSTPFAGLAVASGSGAGGMGSVGTSGSSGGGGGHGGGAATGSMGTGHSGGLSGGSRAGSFGGGALLHPMTASYGGAPRYLPGGFSPNPSGRSLSTSRSATRIATNRPVVATQDGAYAAPGSTRSFAVRPANDWTDASPGAKTAGRQAYAYPANQSAAAYQQYIANGNYTGLTTPAGAAGSRLYPGAYGSALNSYYNGQSPRGTLGYSGPARNFAHAQNWFGPNAGYHRYWPNGYNPYFGAYGYPFYGSEFGYPYAGYYGDDTNLTSDNGAGYNDQSVATMETNPAPSGQPAVQADTDAQNATDGVGPAQPANPDAKASSGVKSNGPDSLIEAVQAELARRGYFTGKVNAMYGPATQEALRRFQTDAGLAATGRINEATMHALQLD